MQGTDSATAAPQSRHNEALRQILPIAWRQNERKRDWQNVESTKIMSRLLYVASYLLFDFKIRRLRPNTTYISA